MLSGLQPVCQLTGSMPAISVLMPVYNGSRWLESSIESILKQTLIDFELIIVNDGSTDLSLEIALSAQEQDSRVRVISLRENKGLSNALNLGLASAKGVWIARLDADDLSMPSRLKEQLSFLEDHPDVVLLGSGCSLVDEDDISISSYLYPFSHSSIYRRLIWTRSCFPHSSVIFKRDIALSLGGYSELFRRSQDIDLWLRLSEVGRLACLPKPLCSVRVHSSRLSSEDGGARQIVFSSLAILLHRVRLKYPDFVAVPSCLFESLYIRIASSAEVKALIWLLRLKSCLRGQFGRSTRAGNILSIPTGVILNFVIRVLVVPIELLLSRFLLFRQFIAFHPGS